MEQQLKPSRHGRPSDGCSAKRRVDGATKPISTAGANSDPGFDPGSGRNPGANAETQMPSSLAQALQADKQEGLTLAVKARWWALAVIALLIIVTDPNVRAIYYLVLLLGFAVNGWAQLRIGRVGRSRAELFLMLFDLALLTVVILVPNPLQTGYWPPTMQLHYGNFFFFYVLLAGATLAYSWRTLVAMGLWTSGLWVLGVVIISLVPVSDPALRANLLAALDGYPELLLFLDPFAVRFTGTIQEVVVFLIVVAILAVNGWRTNRLLLRSAETERERGNLARYFSPNVVSELSQNDEPLKQVRTQKVAVLFVDIIGFTAYANERQPAQVIQTLREFHSRMERQVFAHGGTLDKYLGDGLMATFGTPTAGRQDASNALDCAVAMVAEVKAWNAGRVEHGEVPLQAGFGIHYGEVVLGNIGANRLEFAVIGDTVNTASRLEALTRSLKVPLVVSDALVQQVLREERAGRTRPDPTGAATGAYGASAPGNPRPGGAPGALDLG